MAEATPYNQDLFTCPICLDLLKDPVTILCGHSYCMGCIKGCWDQEDQKGVYSCPQCRQTFSPRPVLNKNNIFAELVEQTRKSRIHTPSLAHGFAGPGDVECDVCTGRKLKAVKSCLDCLVSYCETHFKAHNDLTPGRKHSVTEATGQLQERICSRHKKIFEIFCRTDQSCICYLCTMDEHKGHDTVTAAAEGTDKQKQCRETQSQIQQRIQEREKELQKLRKAVETLKSSAQTAVEDSEKIFTEMIRSIERRCSEVKELIRAQEKAEVSRAEGLLKRLEQEIAELKRRDAELEQLSHTEDHIHFLKSFQSVSKPCQSKDLSCISVNQGVSFEAVKKSVSSLKGQLENFCKEEVMKISAAVTEIHAILTEPVTREDFLQYSCLFTLDPNTAHTRLHLSEGNRTVEVRDELQSYPDHPERFDRWWKVLCREGVSERCYLEVEWSGKKWVRIAVSYKSIDRKGRGNESRFGGNDQSWRLGLYSTSSSFWHNNKQTKLPLVTSSRIGVYVDHRAGTLAFYSISDTMTLLHRVQTKFTHTLYPGFWLESGSSVKLLCDSEDLRRMAEATPYNQDLFTCPICLDLLKDPVTILCGHSYCMGCIKGCWDQEDQKGVYSCPQCRQTFSPRPVLNKNNIVADLLEQIMKTRIHTPSLATGFAGPGDIECDVCTGRKLKAVKSCLDCLVSYCETHFKAHNNLTPGRKHSVIEATGQLQERICSRHKKIFEIFCRTDQSCICYPCLMDEHKGHDTVTAAAERTDKQKQCRETQSQIQQRIQEREKELQELKKAVLTLKSSAQTAVEDSERIFTEMIRSIERRRSEVKELIRAQEKAEVSRAEGLLKRLEQEIAELKRRDAELEQLSHTEDHIHFLKSFQSVSDPCQSKDSSCISVNQGVSFEAVKKSVSSLKGQLENFCKEEVMKISAAVTEVHAILTEPVTREDFLQLTEVHAILTEPVTREDFLQYSCHFTLDPNTAYRDLHLSEGNRRVEVRTEPQSYPDHPERFDGWFQVLCREGVSGRCYWEVEWSGGSGVDISVSYKSISRKGEGNESRFGCNDQSWSLDLDSSSSSFWHNNKQTKLPLVRRSRIGVYVDHRAGTLAFYSLSDTMTLLHRVQTTFTHTLYPGFELWPGSSVRLL
ncbi:uncharacterized protein LOC105898473 [Clupea harengus]|uniref:Uncharacterized protein LOC105898473 n=1 Tax=Clupea harengus TaxID=7950 RepID=A0A6P8FR47_CLUHA|nr:uncharacterized protein LOC105898473 [Clupea harengus]